MITLFNFATKRSPQVLTGDLGSELFIRIDLEALQQSHYLGDVEEGDFRSFRGLFADRAPTFSARQTAAEIRATARRRVAIFERARRTDDAGYVEDLIAQAGELNPATLSTSDRAFLWDSLIDAVWVQRSQVTADAVVAVLVGDHVAALAATMTVGPDGPDPAVLDRLRRRSQARVVIPLPITPPSISVERDYLPRSEAKMLIDTHDRFVAHYEADGIMSAVRAFRVELDQHREEANAAAVAAASEVEARLAGALEGVNIARSRDVLAAALRTETFPVPATISSANVRARLSAVQGARMARFVGTGSPEAAVADAERHVALSRSRALVAADTTQERTFYAFGHEITIEESIPDNAVVVRGIEAAEGGYHV